MHSKFRLESPNLKVTFVIGLCAVALIVSISLIFRDEFGYILLSIAGLFFATGGAKALLGWQTFRHNRQLGNIDVEVRRQELRLITYQADKAEKEKVIIRISRTDHALLPPGADYRIIDAMPNSVRALPSTTHQSLDTRPIELLPALDNAQQVLVVGVTDVGKTTLLQHLVARRQQREKVIVIDPHAYPDKWPGCQVVGICRNYREIDGALTGLVQLMSNRYDDVGKGIVAEMGHSRLTILIDEWRSIVENLGKSAAKDIKTLLCESRKVSISIFVTSQSDRAKPLGLDGEYDLLDGLVIVRLISVGGQRQATMDNGSGEVPVILPGRFVGAGGGQVDEWINLEVEPDQTEAAILTLWAQGEKVSSIAEQVYGHKGGIQNGWVQDVLDKYIPEWRDGVKVRSYD